MLKQLYTLLKVVVYAVAMAIGPMVLLTDPTAKVSAIPLGVGFLLLLHAVYRDEFKRIEYTILGLYIAVLVMLFTTVSMMASGLVVPDTVTSDTIISVVISGVIITIYLGYGHWSRTRDSLQ